MTKVLQDCPKLALFSGPSNPGFPSLTSWKLPPINADIRSLLAVLDLMSYAPWIPNSARFFWCSLIIPACPSLVKGPKVVYSFVEMVIQHNASLTREVLFHAATPCAGS